MIYLTSQPDDSFFIWQLLTLGNNMHELEIPKEDIYHLIGFTGTVNAEWDKWKDKVWGNVVFVPDTRINKNYLVSIRPNIIKQFLKVNPDLSDEYIFYHDADILFTDIPLFEGMEDGRIHVSRTVYLDHNYIESKRSPTLMRDLLRCVGIDEQTIKINEQNTGGAQVYAMGLGYDYWDKVERDCEEMQEVYFKHHVEYDANNVPMFVYDNQEIYKAEYNKQDHDPEFNFQSWTFEMWAMLWNQWLFGFKVYANPALHFTWPNHDIANWNQATIFHNSGIISKLPVEGEQDWERIQREKQNKNWFNKTDWKFKFPDDFSNPCEIGVVDGQMIYGCQLNYLNAVRKTAYKYWLKQEDVISYYLIYVQSDNIEHLLAFYDTKPDPKELFILNTTTNIIKTTRSDISILNTNKSLVTKSWYASFDEMIVDIKSFTKGELEDIKNGYFH